MPYGLKEIELAKLSKVFASNEHIKRVILYGSRAKGNYKLFSDVDITLEGPELTLTDLNHLSLAIDDLLLPYQFDISIFHTLKNHDLIDHIQRIGITIFEPMTEWKEYKLGEIADITPGFAFKSKDFGQTGELVVKIKDIAPPYIELANADHVDLSSYDKNKLSKYLLCEGDYVVAMTGATIGKVGKLKTDKYAYLNQRVAKIKAKEGVCDDFVYFSICGDDFQSFIQNNIDSNSAQENISANSIGRFPVSLPPLNEQRRIASILSSLDDKIDLLHRENATLEQMAETLFRQWFVVEAKEEWEEVALGDVVKTTSGGTPSRKHSDYYENGTINWVKSKELDGSFISSTEELITEEAVTNSSAKMLPEKSVLIAMYGATVGEYGILSKPMSCNQAVCALIPNENYPYTYLYVWTALMKEDFINLASGAAQQNISQDLIKQQIVCSDLDKIKQYDEMVRGYFEKMENNQKQIITLTETRDGLLPRLMSGDVKI